MSRVRYELTGTLALLSPLHIGTGAYRALPSLAGRPDQNDAPPEAAAIVRDQNDAPYLPSTSLKGLLRRLGEALFGKDSTKVATLFGAIKAQGDEDEDGPTPQAGRKGLLAVRGAALRQAAAAIPEAPYVEGAAAELGRGVFVAARTAIDPASKTAADAKLYFQEMVAPGAEFTLRLALEARGRDAKASASEAAHDLFKILGVLAGEDGVALGKGQADGNGRIRLKEGSLTTHIREIDSEGGFSARAAPQGWQVSPAPARTAGEALRLYCEGPFIVIDSSKRIRRPPAEEREGEAPALSAQRLRENAPLILGSSIAGALRARSAWLRALRGQADGEADAIVQTPGEAASLSPVQRLHGVTGFRGLLTIEGLCAEAERKVDFTSLKIDRFSGAPVDGALFRTATFAGVTLSFRLVLEDRGGHGAPTADDRALFAELLASLRADGLELGHGTSKGFGWFRAAQGGAP